MRPPAILALIALVALPAVAGAAAKTGSYSGTSSGRYVQVGMTTEPTDKGKVTFSVKSGQVSNFKLRGQLVQCGPPAEIPVSVKTIKLNSSGKGTGTYKDPSVGKFSVSITVGSTGKASGTIRATRPGLCNADYPVRFTAKRS
jgi:hypothetical protein